MAANRGILLVEDDLVDVKTVKRAFKINKVKNPLFVVKNGEEALHFLRHEENYADMAASARPGLILLDLNMPGMNGIEFLQELKSDQALRTIPVVVLTTSGLDYDIVETYSLGIAGYIIKPVEFADFVQVMKTIEGYWNLAVLPS